MPITLIRYPNIGEPISSGYDQSIITLSPYTKVIGGTGVFGIWAARTATVELKFEYPNEFLD
jgi:hypothetical protein